MDGDHVSKESNGRWQVWIARAVIAVHALHELAEVIDQAGEFIDWIRRF